jgi:hypothetical protein
MRKRTVGALSAATLALAGCGGSDDYANDPRPPAPVNVSVAVTNDRVQVSPERLGAGPVVLIVANESDRSRDLTLASPARGDGSCVEGGASSGPINPQGVANLPVDLVEGECVVRVADRRVKPARLVVGPQRESAQAELLQP